MTLCAKEQIGPAKARISISSSKIDRDMYLYDDWGLGAERGADLRDILSILMRLAPDPPHLSARRSAHQDRRGVGGMAGAPYETPESTLTSEPGLGWSDRASQGLRRHLEKWPPASSELFKPKCKKSGKNLKFFGIINFTQFIYI